MAADLLQPIWSLWHSFNVFIALSIWTAGLLLATIAPAVALAGIVFAAGTLRVLSVLLLATIVSMVMQWSS